MGQQVTGETLAHGMVYPFETAPDKSSRIELAPGVYWLRLPFDFGIDHINLWLLEDGDGWTLVDTGFDQDSTRKIWENWIETLLDGKPIRRVIATHMHPDHVGLAGWLVNKFDAEFCMSRTDYLMCRAMAADTGRKAPEEGVRFYKWAGFNDEALARYRERFGMFGELIHVLPQSYKRLQQGQELKIGNYRWRVEIGMGHTPEHVCLFSPDLNMVIAGDQILPKISSNVSLFPTEPLANPLQDWIDSCYRLIEVLPSDCLVLPAHNDPFYGAHARLKALIDGHEKALARLHEVCETPRRAVDGKIFSVLFKRKIDHSNFFMATGESLSHLMCLVHRGDLELMRDEDGVGWFSQAKA